MVYIRDQTKNFYSDFALTRICFHHSLFQFQTLEFLTDIKFRVYKPLHTQKKSTERLNTL